MFNKIWFIRAPMKELLLIFTVIVVSTADSTTKLHKTLGDSLREESNTLKRFDLEEARFKREARVSSPEQPLSHESSDEDYGTRDKKIPRGFLGLRGKKAPSGFLGLRGRRSDDDRYSEEGSFPYGSSLHDDSASAEELTHKLGEPLEGGQHMTRPWEFMKRAPSGFLGLRGKKAPSGFLGMRGKKAPSGFLGMRGKKAPSGFLGMRGKKAPSGFLGMRGKKDELDYDDLESVLQSLRRGYARNEDVFEEDKRAPRGFLGMRGKKSEENYNRDLIAEPDLISTNEGLGFRPYNDVIYYDNVETSLDKRTPSRFLGLRG